VADPTKRLVAPRHILVSLSEQNPECITHIAQIYIYKNKSMQRGSRIEMQNMSAEVEEETMTLMFLDIYFAHIQIQSSC
jgi:hypothetical protein